MRVSTITGITIRLKPLPENKVKRGTTGYRIKRYPQEEGGRTVLQKVAIRYNFQGTYVWTLKNVQIHEEEIDAESLPEQVVETIYEII